jgi:GntR family transcriptional repressor for pyruvate dehydrogenase complex
MLPDLEPIDLRNREPISSEITRRLLDYLLSGRISPGDRMPSERKLAEGLGVGRSIVRQALQSLLVLGLIEVRQGDGTYLKRTDSPILPLAIEWGLMLGAKRATDLVEARHHLEVLVAGLAAERRDESDIAEMGRQVATMESTSNADAFIAADIAFHLRMALAARNESLIQIMTSIRTLLQVWISRVVQGLPEPVATAAEHAAILHAIEQRDVPGARAAMENHMEHATVRLRRALAEDGSSRDQAAAAGVSAE